MNKTKKMDSCRELLKMEILPLYSQYTGCPKKIEPFFYLQVQPKNVEFVTMCWKMYLLNYRCLMTEYNYNTTITQ
jgi:hypothetical protein